MIYIVEFIVTAFRESPYHVITEIFFAVLLLVLLLQKAHNPTKEKPLTKKEEDELIAEWEPEPLSRPLNEEEKWELSTIPLIESKPGIMVTMNGKKTLNFGSYNFLGVVDLPEFTEAAKKEIYKYGVGTCGPRGFYGTLQIHLDLEQRLAKFMGTPEAILYAYGFATISSAIPTLAKRGDVIFCDEGVSFAVQTGVTLSRSKVYYFRHNDVDHLEEFLKLQDEIDQKYSCRLAIEESLSLGVLGKTERGICEYYNISRDAVECTTSSLGNAFSSVGGFCCGSAIVVKQQTLLGAGYCFSASLPALLCGSSLKVLDILEHNEKIEGPDNIFSKLKTLSLHFRAELAGIHGLEVAGDPSVPLVHLRLNSKTSQKNRHKNERILQEIVNKCFESEYPLGLTRAKYSEEEYLMPPPSIRICISASHSKEQLTKAAQVLKKVAESVFRDGISFDNELNSNEINSNNLDN
ncbi:serine palmitoyltransferase 1 [Anaeramoeba ignava]|uniref:serine C-palmitoyltransferase n=1 Tax=Anaeramoeba ignava TaxID=1746090 RepID=A0A9Q0LAU0_ANAIG|nr:serine palmitoyltransferase 1 [Anaeramoeba ignava]